MNGRVYDAVIGRFMSADPIGAGWGLGSQGLNRYSYVGNKPLSYTDPTGFSCSGGVYIDAEGYPSLDTCASPFFPFPLDSRTDYCLKFGGAACYSDNWGGMNFGGGAAYTPPPVTIGDIKVSFETTQNQRCSRQKPIDDGITFNDFVDFSAGLGDALLLGFGDNIRAALDIGSVDINSTSYEIGSWTSLAFGVGRLGYAALAKGYSVAAPTGAAASTFRSSMRMKNAPVRDLSKYGTDAQLRAAAGRTNPYVNAYVAGVTASGAYGANGCN